MLYQQRVKQGVDAVARATIPRLPALLKRMGGCVPEGVQYMAVARSLNYLFRRAIAEGDLDFFYDKKLHVCIKDIGLDFSVRYDGKKLQVTRAFPNVDLRFGANSYDLFLIATQKLDPDMLFFQRRLEMNGDTELGLAIKNLLGRLELNEQVHPRLAHLLNRMSKGLARFHS